MSALDHYDYRQLQVAKDGSLVDEDQVGALRTLADDSTDVLVVSHGWHNDMAEAHALYERLAASLDAVRRDPDLDGADGADGANGADRTVAICGVMWPSKRFAERALISGGAAAAGAADPHLGADVLDLASAFDGDEAKAVLKEAAALAPDLERSSKARRRYADLLRSLVTREESEPSDAMDQFFALDGDELMDRIEAATIDLMTDLPAPEHGGAAAGVSGLGSAQGLFSGLASKGRMLLNMVTYYEMKNRAGTIGAGTVGPVLADNVVGRARLHLAGHSFGARLVTAAASVQAPGTVASMSLLQAAFSHNAFAKNWKPGRDGAYRKLVTSGIVDGPVVITHTRHDVAVGIAYAMASRIAGQQDSAIGDASSTFGGLGSNGAQHTPEAVKGTLEKVGSRYALEPGRLHNLLADEFVSGHSDVTGQEVASAVWQAVLAGSRSHP